MTSASCRRECRASKSDRPINAEQHGFAIEDEEGVAVTQRGLRGSLQGVQFNAHLTHRGDVVLEHACKMGLEGMVSKRLGSRYAPVAPATGSSSKTRQHTRMANARLPFIFFFFFW